MDRHGKSRILTSNRRTKRNIDKIYVNGKFLNRRDQGTEVSGTPSSGNRCYKLAAVSLVLLCVLLLVGVTLLWINFTAEMDQKNTLQTLYINLTSERDQLQTKYNNLNIEKDHLQTLYNNLTSQRDQLQMSYNKLIQKEDQCPCNLISLKRAKDELDVLCELSKNECQMYKDGELQYFNSSIYYISTKKKSWNESQNHCKDRGADLVIINSREEQMFLQYLRGDNPVWIGLTDPEKNNKWKWVDDSALTTEYWRAGEPNGPNEYCVMSGHGPDARNWADYPCNDKFGCICERRMGI